MVATRRAKRQDEAAGATATAADTDAPAPKRQRRGKDTERERASAAATSGEGFSDTARAAWDAFFREQFFFRPPSEFYALYELARALRGDKPLDVFVESAGIRLSGPFELLHAADAGKKEVAAEKPLFLHGRFSSDPPEVLTALVDARDSVGEHWGYFRDAPEEDPRYVVRSPDCSKVAFEIAGSSLLQVLVERMPRDAKRDPKSLRSKVDALIAEHSDHSATSVAQLKKQREREATAPSLHGLGIVVPVNSKTETGFRELPIVGPSLASLLERVRDDPGDARSRAKVSELVTRATIASDECDFGTGLLLGLDLLTAGPCLQKEATQLLRVAYSLLKRGAFFKIVKAQWAGRPCALKPLQALCDPKEGVAAPKAVALPPADRGQH